MATSTLPPDVDPECVELCNAINLLPGIQTRESCSGHGEGSYHIFIEARNLESLPPLLYWFDGCHCGCYDWRVIVRTDCAMRPVYFMIEGPVGAYEEAYKIAGLIRDYVEEVD